MWVACIVQCIRPQQRTTASQMEMLSLWSSTRRSCITAPALLTSPHSSSPFFFFRAGRSSLHLPSDLPIPCLLHWREISTDEKTQKIPAGANLGSSVTEGVSSEVSERGWVSLRDADAGWFQGLAPVLQWGIVSTLIRSWLQHFPRAVGEGEKGSPWRGARSKEHKLQ